MKLENYISDLLYRYECVIVPEFGGFISSEMGSRIDYNRHHFYPPYKKIAFNAYLKNNDGLLINYIASVDQISFEEATEWVQKSLLIWNEKIGNGIFSIPKIGSFHHNKEGKLQFEPDKAANYLTTSFGLSPIVSNVINREVLKVIQKPTAIEQPLVGTFSTPEPVKITASKNKNPIIRTLPTIAKYAAIATIAVTLFGLGNKYYQQKLQEEFIAATQQHQQQTEKNIQQATFVISNLLPTITIQIETEAKNFHVIAGAFRNIENAEKLVTQLKQLGYDAHIIGTNKWNLTKVAYESFTSMDEATKALTPILNKVDENAWVLVTEN